MTHLMREITLFCPKILKKHTKTQAILMNSLLNLLNEIRRVPLPSLKNINFIAENHHLQRENDFLNPKNQEKN
jgi:hypothetical protein